MQLNVVELVLFDDDVMCYCNFPLLNEQNSSLFYYYLPRRIEFCLGNSRTRLALLRIG